MACTGTRGKSGRRPPWTEPDARHGKLGKTMADAHRARNWTRAMKNWAKPRTRHTHVHICIHGPLNILYGESGKKVADARRARNWTRDMQNWAKPRTGHAHVHGPVIGLYGKTGKKWPTPVVPGTGRAPRKTGQNNVRRTHTYMDQKWVREVQEKRAHSPWKPIQ